MANEKQNLIKFNSSLIINALNILKIQGLMKDLYQRSTANLTERVMTLRIFSGIIICIVHSSGSTEEKQ